MGAGEQVACTSDQVPAWSGLFWEDEDFGYVSVHVADTRTHAVPAGFRLIRIYADLDDDAQVFEYRRVVQEGPYADVCSALVG